MARPRKFTPERQQVIVAALRSGATRTAAAGLADVNPGTIANWLMSKPGFRDAVEHAEAQWMTAMAGRITVGAARGDWKAAAWMLERHPRSRAEWGPNAKQLIVVEGGEEPVKVLHAGVGVVADPAAQFAQLQALARTMDVLVRVGLIGPPPRLLEPVEDDE